ncbi:tetratricopeptide repeat protein [Planctomycetota bacterium]|nr:tetratricopeptide repeat protein [Planctomycetota bacterium]
MSDHVDLLAEWSLKQTSPRGVHTELAFFLASLGRFDEAIISYEAALAAHPEQLLFTLTLVQVSIPEELVPAHLQNAPTQGPASEGEPIPVVAPAPSAESGEDANQ